MSSPNSCDDTEAWRAAIQLTLPRSVLISPLCADHAVGVRQRPGREGVGGEALVHQRERRSRSPARAGRDSSCRAGRRGTCPCRRRCGTTATRCRSRSSRRSRSSIDDVGDHLAQDVEPALELVLARRSLGRAPMKTCRWNGSVGFTDLAERGIVGRHVAPAEQRPGLPAAPSRHRCRGSPSAIRGSCGMNT